MAIDEIVRWGSDRLRVGRWQGNDTVAHVAPVPGTTPSATAVTATLRTLEERGFDAVVTSALSPREQEPFLTAGFDVHEYLHLLAHALDHIPSVPKVSLRRGRRLDIDRVLRIDHRAFRPFWRLDHDGLRDALAATPSSRFRVAEGRGPIGYAVSGRAGAIGYLQRLAVDPDSHGRGIGSALVADGLTWMRRRGARRALVNTQLDNDRALELYERMGFRPEPHRLAVLRRRLHDE
jgi:ribosomal protein S18 acetylase RimI-like enzyme